MNAGAEGAGAGATGETHVAFVGATGRSGSTLLSRLLGSVPGVCSVGELCWIWPYGVIQDRECGCGRTFGSCPFWTAVGRHAYGGWERVDAERANELRRRLTKNVLVPQLLTRPSSGVLRDVDEYAALMSPLYHAIGRESGARVVVDNSKQAGVALLTRRTPGVRLSVVHLVRRSHGVAYSWTKHVARSDKAGKEMRRRGPARTALRWSVDNVVFELLGRTGSPRLLVRYEDLVSDVRPEVAAILRFLGVDLQTADSLFPGRDEVVLATDHSVWGNPMRLRSGPERLRPDDAWRAALDRRDRRMVTSLSLPGLVRYGYLRE